MGLAELEESPVSSKFKANPIDSDIEVHKGIGLHFWHKSEMKPHYVPKPNLNRMGHTLVIEVGSGGSVETGVASPAQRIQAWSPFATYPDLQVPSFPENEIKWHVFVEGLRDTDMPKVVVDSLDLVRSQLHMSLGSIIDPPDVAPGEEGGLELSWRCNNKLMEVEILPDGSLEWFFKYTDTGEFDGGEGLASDDFPPLAMQSFLRDWARDLDYVFVRSE